MQTLTLLIQEVIERLDAKTVLQCRPPVARQADESAQPRSTELIHSQSTRLAYQEHVVHFVTWCHDQGALTRLDQLDARAEELASRYLEERLAAGKSVWTLLAERSALRLFFTRRELAAGVVLPRRRREAITRSRRLVLRTRDFQPANWQSEIQFLCRCGLRRGEALALRVGDIHPQPDGRVTITVPCGKAGGSRVVPVLPGEEACLLSLIEGRHDPAEYVFVHLPRHLDVHAVRRVYAQHLYQQLSGRALPPAEGRLRREQVDHGAVRQIAQALGLSRVSDCLDQYLRSASVAWVLVPWSHMDHPGMEPHPPSFC